MQTIDTSSNMVTFTGRYIDPYNLTVDDINIIDIATGLSRTCRFAGQCKEFYSVAQHSVYVSKYSGDNPDLSPKENLQNARIGLLHDAPEAYIGDLVKCVKAGLRDYGALEEKVWRVIAKKFNLNTPEFNSAVSNPLLPPPVIEADNRVLVTERLALINEKSAVWNVETQWKPYDDFRMLTGPWSPDFAKRIFLERFEELFELSSQNPFYERTKH